MVKQTAGRDRLGKLAPKFAELNDDILFGEVWSREDKLSLRDRSMITVTALMTKGIFDSSLKSHLITAKKNGITKTEMVEMITHLAFYSGWPNAWAVFNMLEDVYGATASALWCLVIFLISFYRNKDRKHIHTHSFLYYKRESQTLALNSG